MAAVVAITALVGWAALLGRDLWLRRQVRRQVLYSALIAGVALGLALALNQIIGHAWFRDRPYVRHPDARLLVDPSADPSLPSDHAAAGTAIALGLATVSVAWGASVL